MALFEPGSYDASALTPATRALAAGTPADPPPAHRINSFALQVALQSDPPGWWAGNVWEQYQNYQGAVAIAIEAYMTALKGAKYNVLRRKAKVQKSLGGGQGIYSRDDDYEPVEPDHPLAQVLAEPSGEDGVWTMADEAAFIALQNQLTGTSFVWMPRNRDGKPVRLFGLTTGSITQTIAPGNPMYPQGAYMVTPYVGNAGWMAGGGMVAQSTPLPAEEVQRFRRLNPVSRTFGLSRLDTGARDIDMLKAITEFRWSYFNSGVALDTVVMLPGADQETQERTERQLLQKSGGAKNARKLLVVGGNVGEGNGKASIQQLAPNAKDLDFPQGFEQALGQVLAIFGVPKLVANFGDSSNYATFHGELRRFYDNTISPFCRDLSAFLTRALARPWSEYAGEYVIEIEPQIPKDVDAERTELQSALSAGAITVNEYRMATGRDAWDDGDEPLAIVMAKKQQAAQPAPMPGMDPNAPPGAEAAALPSVGDARAVPGGEEQPAPEGDDSPEGVQDATLQAALSALGMGGDAASLPVQKSQWEESKHPRDHGKFSSKPGTDSSGPLDASSASHDEWIASAISPEDAAPLLSKIRAGDERSKNKGDRRPEPVLRPVVLASVPIASLPERIIQQLRETTSAERVKEYASQKIDTPAILTVLRSGDGLGVSDGGHRIMAAIARGDTHVSAFVPVGSYELLKKFEEPVMKAAAPVNKPRKVRQEGETWTGRDGKRWTKKGGKIVEAPQQTGSDAAQPAAAPGAQRYPSKFNEGITYGHEDDRDADDKAFGRDIRAAVKQVNDLKAKLAAAQAKLPDSHPVVKRARAALQEATEKANAARAKADALKTGSSAAPKRELNADGTYEIERHFDKPGTIDRLLKKGGRKYGIDRATLERLPEPALRVMAAQMGIVPAEHVYAYAAQSVPVTPRAQQVLQRAAEWADSMAQKHAQAVAQRLGIRPELAQKILAKAIRQVAEHALKNGGRASGTLSVGGQSVRLGVGAKRQSDGPPPREEAKDRPGTAAGSPIGKAMNTLSDADGGFLVAPATPRRRRRAKVPVAALVRKALAGG